MESRAFLADDDTSRKWRQRLMLEPKRIMTLVHDILSFRGVLCKMLGGVPPRHWSPDLISGTILHLLQMRVASPGFEVFALLRSPGAGRQYYLIFASKRLFCGLRFARILSALKCCNVIQISPTKKIKNYIYTRRTQGRDERRITLRIPAFCRRIFYFQPACLSQFEYETRI